MKKIIYAVLGLSFMFSCSNNSDDDIVTEPKGDYENSILIINEGNFGKNNSSISSWKNDEVEHKIFKKVNSKDLGDTAQSLEFNDDKAFIVVNVSNKIEIVNRYTFKSIATITENLKNPRYITISGDYAYVTNWGDASDKNDDFVTKINLKNYSTTTIPVSYGPEKITEENGKVFVAHNGGYFYNNIISVIDESQNNVVKTITVGDVPNSMALENDKLYVVSSGKPAYSGDETGGAIHIINTKNLDVISSTNFDTTVHPSRLSKSKDKMYFLLNQKVYQLNPSTTNISYTEKFSLENKGITSLYGFDVINDKFYITDANDYSADGKAVILNNSGEVEKEFPLKVNANSFYLNN